MNKPMKRPYRKPTAKDPLAAGDARGAARVLEGAPASAVAHCSVAFMDACERAHPGAGLGLGQPFGSTIEPNSHRTGGPEHSRYGSQARLVLPQPP